MDDELLRRLDELSFLSSNKFKYTNNNKENKLLLKEYLCKSEFYDLCREKYGKFTFEQFKEYFRIYEEQYGPLDDIGLAIYLYETILWEYFTVFSYNFNNYYI